MWEGLGSAGYDCVRFLSFGFLHADEKGRTDDLTSSDEFTNSLPYLFRFRQCLSEVLTGSTPTPRRSMLNALKYATAFPVIALSAMQTVIGDPFDEDDEGREAGEAWIGRGTLFTLW